MSPRVKLTVNALAWVVLFTISFSNPTLAADESADLLGFQITFLGSEYDAAKDESTWRYRVRGTIRADKDLSHWLMVLCKDHTLAKQGNRWKASHRQVEVGYDPTTGYTGIKFDVEVDKETGDTIFWFVLKGNWQVGEVMIAGKAGKNIGTATLPGPLCTGPACEIFYSVTHGRIDFRAMRPGTYAAPLSVMELSGTGAAKIVFDDFDHAVYLREPSAPPVILEYSFGSTLEEAEANGWMSVETLNGMELSFSKAELQQGVEITLWMRYTIRDLNYSSDYRTAGTVSIVPDCI